MADLIMLKFDDPYGAQQALSAARALEELRYAWIDARARWPPAARTRGAPCPARGTGFGARVSG